jgi:hypothetical protein
MDGASVPVHSCTDRLRFAFHSAHPVDRSRDE